MHKLVPTSHFTRPISSSLASTALQGITASIIALAAVSLVPQASADDFPERPISVLVGFGPGGGSDLMARAITSAINESNGYTFRVENMPGAAGLVAASEAFSRPADGYTILQQSDGIVASVASGEIEGKFGEDILPVCLTQSTFSQIYVRADDDRFESFEDFESYASDNRVTMANSSRPGTMEYILATSLADALDADIEIVNFNNPSERYAALLGGQVDILLEQPGDVSSYLEGGQFKPILTFLDKRPKAFPDTPALSELGLETVPPLERIRGLFVNGDVPSERVALLGEACTDAYETDAYQAFNESQFMDPDRSLRVGDQAVTFLKSLEQAYRDASEDTQS